VTPDQSHRRIRIRTLNDTFRQSFLGGRILCTQGVSNLPSEESAALLERVRTFDQFDSDNDPHHEHDFGAIEFERERYFFKIDYYDKAYEYGSEDPADPEKTTRVMTIMRADEY
jgi:Protein of unknown function (DUF3768)